MEDNAEMSISRGSAEGGLAIRAEVRGLMSGTVTAGQIGWVFLISAVLVAVFAPLTMYLSGNKK